MESALTDNSSALAVDQSTALPRHSLLDDATRPGLPETEEALQAAFRDELNDSQLVLSPQYIGSDRRASGFRAWVHRATFGARRSLLRLELVVVAVVVVVATASVLLVGSAGHNSASASQAASKRPSPSPASAHAKAPAATPAPPAPTATVPAPTTTVPAPTTTVAPSAPAPAAAAQPAPAPAPAAAAPVAAAPAPAAAAPTPAQLGAQALTLVRYPWQSIPGYSIQFLPISDAPSPGFYGNTTFTWGQPGGTSDLYVYPGETVDQLAGITAFEIGHEVDAAAVDPQGGEAQIENILGIHPASWAPDCDCAEQGFLSGWYAAAFSNYWSPGVGDWSQIAPEPSGAVLAAVEPWLDPTIR
jgi:hypothetical protein